MGDGSESTSMKGFGVGGIQQTFKYLHKCAFIFKKSSSFAAESRGSVVGTATGYVRPGRPSCEKLSRGRFNNSHFSLKSRPALGSRQPCIQWVPWALSPRVKRTGSETDHSSPTSAEVKKTFIYTLAPSYVFFA
jgi:hypothetical protein